MKPETLHEERLARLLGASRAPADPAVLARARARIAARASVPGVAVWLGRPAVLAGAGLLFALCLVGALSFPRAQATTTPATGLISSLLGEEDLGLPIATTDAGVAADPAAGDSGEVTP
jgi:hypothetical protein